MHIRCPHCRNAVEVIQDAALDEIVCPSCGSRFSLVQDSTVPYTSHEGRRVAHFELIESLGVGSFGTVWRARDTELNRDVAVKIPRSERLSPSESESFLREARAAAQLKHPNIVAVHEVGRDDGTIYIVSDLVKGVTLSSWLTGHQPTQKEAAELCAKIAHALHHAHESGVIHRDLKPSNVMLDGNAEPHILDFGLAKRDAGEITMTVDGKIFGTPAYMSPEQATGRGHQADRRSDVYSLGIILFELLTGELPFRGDTHMLLHQVVNEEPPSPRKLNNRIAKDLETICLRCLEKKPERRYGTAKEVGDDLRRWLHKEPIKARPVGMLVRTMRWCQRNPALTAFVAMLVLAVVGLSAATAPIIRAQRQRTFAQIDSLLNVEPNAVPTILESLKPFHGTVAPRLRELLQQALSDNQRWRLSLALLPEDESQIENLRGRLLQAPPDELQVLRDTLYDYRAMLVGRLWSVAEDPSTSRNQKLRAACVLAKYDSTNTQWRHIRDDVVTALVSVPPTESKLWIVMLRPVGAQLVEPLQDRYRDRRFERDETGEVTSSTWGDQLDLTERPLTAAALADYLSSQPKRLIELILLADNDQEFLPFLEALRPHRRACVDEFRSFVNESPTLDGEYSSWQIKVFRITFPKEKQFQPDVLRDLFWKEQANAAVCLLRLDEPSLVWPLLKHSPNPSLRSFIIDRVARLGTDPKTLADRLTQETDPSIRQALILALGGFDAGKFSTEQRRKLVESLSVLYRHDSDSGVHSAAGWTLRQYHADDALARLDGELQKQPTQIEQKNRRWFINSQGQTFVVVDSSVNNDPPPVEHPWKRSSGGGPSKKGTIAYRFAMATHEVTVRQFKRFTIPKGDRPAGGVTWFGAVAYCNWLSEKEGIPKEQWCYERNDKGDYGEGMKIPADFLQRTGYRLPTEDEWECVCRAKTSSTFSFGVPTELLDRYAWYQQNSRIRIWPVGLLKPNDFGVFDMYGNVSEWCQDRWKKMVVRNSGGSEIVEANQPRAMRGGDFDSRPDQVTSIGGQFPGLPVFFFGFRPARTLP